MINTGLANNIIETFGCRKPNRPEKLKFKTTFTEAAPPYPKQNTKSQEMATLAKLIQDRLGPLFQATHNELNSPSSSKKQPSKNFGQQLVKLKDHFLDEIETMKTKNSKSNQDLDKIGNGITTAFAFTALLLKSIVSKLNQTGQLTKENFDKFFQSGLTFIDELASLPQSLLLLTVNYLCEKKLNYIPNNDDHYIANQNVKFSEKRFETDLANGELGTVNDFVANFKTTFDRLCKRCPIDDYKKRIQLPTFGCPAKYARVNLEIDGQEKSVNFIEAAYRITTKIVSNSLFREQELADSKSNALGSVAA